jgi:hypothetical protein
MAAPSLHVPLPVRAKTDTELVKALLRIQAKEGGKVRIIAIMQDTKSGEWVAWYEPISNFGSGLM